jgi:predicted O-methyltransferase YrrM
MTEAINQTFPPAYKSIDEQTKKCGFTMASDVLTCSLLRTLAASKPGGKCLELGTGTGLSSSWILDGLNDTATLTSIDNDPAVLEIAKAHLGSDSRLQLICTDGATWVETNIDQRYDYIFADTWHGKYLMLDEVLAMLNKGGLYIVDDMAPQPNWPEGHSDKVDRLIETLEDRDDLILTKQAWASGVIVAVKR